MEYSTLGIIYALKHKDKEFDEAVIEFWSKHTDTDPKWYNENMLMQIAVNTIRDFIQTADNPSYVLYELFENMRFDCKRLSNDTRSFDKRIRDAIWATLDMMRVKDDNGNFVNGFAELETEVR